MLSGLLIGRPGWTELIIVVGAIVILFGASKIPEIARSVGRAKGEYKKGAKMAEDELADLEDEEEEEADESTSPDGARV